MNHPKRDEIGLIDFNPARGSEQSGQRSAVIIQNDVGNRVADTTIIAAISTNLRPNPTNVLIKATKATGLNQDSMVKTSQVLTISKDRLIKRFGKIDKQAIATLKQALKISLSLD